MLFHDGRTVIIRIIRFQDANFVGTEHDPEGLFGGEKCEVVHSFTYIEGVSDVSELSAKLFNAGAKWARENPDKKVMCREPKKIELGPLPHADDSKSAPETPTTSKSEADEQWAEILGALPTLEECRDEVGEIQCEGEEDELEETIPQVKVRADGLQPAINVLKQVNENFKRLGEEANLCLERNDAEGQKSKLRESAELIMDLSRRIEVFLSGVDIDTRITIGVCISNFSTVTNYALASYDIQDLKDLHVLGLCYKEGRAHNLDELIQYLEG